MLFFSQLDNDSLFGAFGRIFYTRLLYLFFWLFFDWCRNEDPKLFLACFENVK